MSLELSNSVQIARFGGWLKEQRVGLGLSLREAAWRSGISLQRLTSIETGTLAVD
jgi:cytoskeletal protein RodZ